MKPATLAAAEQAKESLAARLSGLPELRAVGIAVLDDGFGVKVILSRPLATTTVPDDVDGVPVVVDIAGTIEAL